MNGAAHNGALIQVVCQSRFGPSSCPVQLKQAMEGSQWPIKHKDANTAKYPCFTMLMLPCNTVIIRGWFPVKLCDCRGSTRAMLFGIICSQAPSGDMQSAQPFPSSYLTIMAWYRNGRSLANGLCFICCYLLGYSYQWKFALSYRLLIRIQASVSTAHTTLRKALGV